jgi:hypothetical protein
VNEPPGWEERDRFSVLEHGLLARFEPLHHKAQVIEKLGALQELVREPLRAAAPMRALFRGDRPAGVFRGDTAARFHISGERVCDMHRRLTSIFLAKEGVIEN